MPTNLRALFDQYAKLASEIEAEAKRRWRDGELVSWSHHGYEQRGEIIKNLTYGDRIRLRCCNRRTNRVVDVRYSTNEGLYS